MKRNTERASPAGIAVHPGSPSLPLPPVSLLLCAWSQRIRPGLRTSPSFFSVTLLHKVHDYCRPPALETDEKNRHLLTSSLSSNLPLTATPGTACSSRSSCVVPAVCPGLTLKPAVHIVSSHSLITADHQLARLPHCGLPVTQNSADALFMTLQPRCAAAPWIEKER